MLDSVIDELHVNTQKCVKLHELSWFYDIYDLVERQFLLSFYCDVSSVWLPGEDQSVTNSRSISSFSLNFVWSEQLLMSHEKNQK